MWGLPEGCEGPVCRLSLPALPHDHPVRHDPQTQSGIRIAQPPQHRHRRWRTVSHTRWIPQFLFSSLLISTAAVKQEFHLEEDNFFTEDEYVEEEEDDDDDDEDEVSSSEKGLNKKCRGRANGEPRMKMRRIFRITHGRERQRGDRRNINNQYFSTWKPFRIKCLCVSSVRSQRPRRSSDPL